MTFPDSKAYSILWNLEYILTMFLLFWKLKRRVIFAGFVKVACLKPIPDVFWAELSVLGSWACVGSVGQ